MLLHSRVCVRRSERAHNYSFCSALLTPLFCNTAGYPFSPLSLIQLSYTALRTHSPGPSPMPAWQFSDKALHLHTYMCEKNTESSLTVARISLSSSHSCFNRLADILRYLVPSLCSGGPSHPSPASAGAHEIGRAARCVRHMGPM